MEAEIDIGGCPACGGLIFEEERFCELCGSPVTGPDDPVGPSGTTAAPDSRQVHDLGAVAAVSDPGRRRTRNEDAVSVATASSGACVVALADGVGSTLNSDRASRAAVDAALGVLEVGLGAPAGPGDEVIAERLARAFDVAQRAVLAVPSGASGESDLMPSTTLVAAVTRPGGLAVASVGDSRAYWLSESHPDGGRILTVDDSWAQDRIAEGVPAVEAYRDPEAHTITRWLGADAPSTVPGVASAEVSEAGVLVVCSDGLWNYFDTPAQMLDVIRPLAGVSPRSLAERLVAAALEAGGHDNVTVAVALVGPAPPSPTGAPASRPTEE